jgi:hypothetical protein
MEKPDSEDELKSGGVVERGPYEHLLFRKVLFDNAQYTLILARGLHLGDKRMRCG